MERAKGDDYNDDEGEMVGDYPKDGEAREFLTMACRLIDQGNPSQALQVVMATRVQGGDEAVFHFLNRAREQYRTRLLVNSAVDQLDSLFAEYAIAEAQSLRVEPSVCSTSGQPIKLDSQGPSILRECARMQIVLDALQMGVVLSVCNVEDLLASTARMSIMPTGVASLHV